MTFLLARIDFDDNTIWAVLIGWVMSVTLHEFAHGLVAYWGGDYTIRERGGLTLNPIQYVDPLMSIVLPIVFLLMGGIPLPGGATYIRRDLLRSRGWDAGVSAAGPAMNLILFGLLAIPLLPQIGWIDVRLSPLQWTTAQKFVAAMCYLQLLSVILNLVPVPPLDGFGIIGPFMNQDTRLRLMMPPTSTMLFLGFFLILQTRGFQQITRGIMESVMGPTLARVTTRGFAAVFFPEAFH
jgi:Zn-dependent protease